MSGLVYEVLTPTFIGGWLGGAAILGALYFITGRLRARRPDKATAETGPVKDGFFAGMATSALGDGVIRLLKSLASRWP
jgi:ABC-type Fe3+-siderophore transport system permease subunit